MKVAIAGSCGLAQYIAHAASDEGHDALLLSRSDHPEFAPLQVVRVDYTVPVSLHNALLGVDTLVSTVTNADAQQALIDACLTARVRRFAPAEFEGPPSERPMVAAPGCGSDKITVLNRLREEKHRLESTVFVCGLLYQRFHPLGLGGSGVCSSIGPLKAEGDFLMSIRDAKAVVPSNNGGAGGCGGDVRACFTAAEDVGRFVAKALAMDVWDEQLRFFGQRLKLMEVVWIAEQVWGHPFEIAIVDWDLLSDQQQNAEDADDETVVLQTDALLATQRGEFDFPDANLNARFQEVVPIKLQDWLEAAWRDEDRET